MDGIAWNNDRNSRAKLNILTSYAETKYASLKVGGLNVRMRTKGTNGVRFKHKFDRQKIYVTRQNVL